MSEMKKVLFVCLGNICRSPIAEAVFKHIIEEKGLTEKWFAESAAIGPWHIGKSPDNRVFEVLNDKKIKYEHKARRVTDDDFETFDFIFGMDDENMYDLRNVAKKCENQRAKVELLGSYDPEGELLIEDPYYLKGNAGFYKCYEQCVRSCTAFLEKHK